jgi:hypothetical protein
MADREYYNQEIDIAARFVAMRNVEGDYYEFGIGSGRSFVFAHSRLTHWRRQWAAHHLQRGLVVPDVLTRPIRYFAFDSFEGLPAPSGLDASSRLPSFWQAGQFAASEASFRAGIAAAGVPLDRLFVTAGWFKDTLNEDTRVGLGGAPGCIFHVDCDLYESTRLVLEFITPLYVDGSVVIFDEWFGFRGHPAHGEQRAFSEWRERHGINASELSRSDGQRVSFVLHRP